jgi:hypothetical protein
MEATMHVGYAAVLLLLLTAGCAPIKPDTPASEPRPTQPGAPPLVAQPAAPAPAPSGRTPGPQTTSKVAPPVAKTPTAGPSLDLKTLEAQLKSTKAIGLFTKIALKNQVDDLLDRFSDYYKGKATHTMTDLRRSYDLLMMKVLTLLQNDDQKLASDIVSSREAIWRLLANPKTFATLHG